MTEEQQELYDLVCDWWDSAFTDRSHKSRSDCLVDLVNSIIEWRNRDDYVEDPWNLRPRRPMEPVWKSWEEPKRSSMGEYNERQSD